jgi:predicted enzyme related to lactoylglutathione lyase
MIEKVRTVTIYVEDQERAIAFYKQKLGFRVLRTAPMGPKASWLEMAPPGAETRVVLYPRWMMPDWAQRKLSIVFGCADAQKTCEELKSRGVQFIQEPRLMGWGARFGAFVDPDGNELGLTEEPR